MWGFGEGFFYVVLSDKINAIKNFNSGLNFVAFICSLIAILIHGIFPYDVTTAIEAVVTFILIYGSLIVRYKTDNSWGNITIFFLIWNAF